MKALEYLEDGEREAAAEELRLEVARRL